MPDRQSESTVTIVQRRLTGYRVPFFEALKKRLEHDRIRLRLMHGMASDSETSKDDAGQITWAEPLATTYFANDRACWQPFSKQVAGSDLIIMTQENSMLANHLALISRPSPKLAFWGHGANLQGDERSLRERYKRWSTKRVDWYFAYTKLSVGLVTATGFDRNRITCLNNAVDVAALKDDLSSVTSDDLQRIRDELGLGPGPIGLFLGSFYEHKRLRFLVQAAVALRSRIKDFQMIIVGAGPDIEIVEAAAARYNWLHCAGPRRGRDKAAILSLGTVLMNPGLVGLGILDSFAANLPMITTDCGLHSPEIAYLDQSNGVMTEDDIGKYVGACEELLMNSTGRARLIAGCRIAAERYTLTNMVENFADGVQKALALQT